MKKIIIVLLGFCFLYNSCSLDTTPTDRYITSGFWQNEEQINAGLTACYETLRSEWLYGGQASAIYSDVITPNAYMYDNTHGWGVIGKGLHNLSNSGVINGKWGQCYEGIGRCNSVIEYVTPFQMDEAKKKQWIAEAKYLRAMYYFELVNYYGSAPLILEVPNIETQIDLPRTSKEELIKQILSDLTDAANALPEKYTASGDVGRPTKYAAIGLMARLYLYNERWQEAEDACRQIMESGRYELYPNYRQIFARDNEGNSEVIFDIQFLNPLFTHSADLIMRQYNICAPLLDIVKAYDMADGTPYDDSKPLYEDRDPRFYQSIIYPGTTFMGKPVTNDFFKFTGYTYKKFSVYDTQQMDQYDWNDINMIYLRYADVLLMFAEARNERLGSPDQEVYDALNLIRDRESVKMPLFEIAKNYSKEDMRKIIRHERRIELVCEGLYYNDIRRWGIAKEVMNGPIYKHDGTMIETRVFQDKDYLWPVPEREIRENPNLLPNNPGW